MSQMFTKKKFSKILALYSILWVCRLLWPTVRTSVTLEHTSLTKLGRVMFNMNPPVIHKSNTMKQSKKEDVNNLLNKHYGDQWKDENLVFYKNIDEAINNR